MTSKCLDYLIKSSRKSLSTLHQVRQEGNLRINQYSLIFDTINLILSAFFRYSLKNLYMLEFHPCLAAASRIPGALKQAIEVRTRQLITHFQFRFFNQNN
jgi:hypothetical protein